MPLPKSCWASGSDSAGLQPNFHYQSIDKTNSSFSFWHSKTKTRKKKEFGLQCRRGRIPSLPPSMSSSIVASSSTRPWSPAPPVAAVRRRNYAGPRGESSSLSVSTMRGGAAASPSRLPATTSGVSFLDRSRFRKNFACSSSSSSHPPPLSSGDGPPAALPGNASSMSNILAVDSDVKEEAEVLIECRDVHKSFGDKHILRGVSFKIRHGEAVGIIGPSGTGKSTVLKVIAGLLAPDKGEVLIRGKKRQGLVGDEDISGLRIGLVFQSAALFDSLSVRENVGFLLYENSRMAEDRISQLVAENLAAVGLKGVEDRFPSELSGGMKKRVALARSIIYDDTKEAIEPEVLLYDEPTAGLDPIASTVVEDLIRSVHVEGQDAVGKPGKIASYIVVTHQHSTIRRAVDRLLFLFEGRIVWEGMVHEFNTTLNPIVRQFASGNLDGPIRY